MKVSLNKLKYINMHHDMGIDLVPNGIDDLVTKIGAQLGAVEEIIPYGKRFAGAIVVKVVECEKHPGADKLSLCLVDDGGVVEHVERNDHGLVQVVCGAPNVRAGMLAAWLPPGATVPSTRDNDPFVLEARELRGKVSNGMLASSKELGIGDSHDGILEVDRDVSPGTSFADTYCDVDEVVIDIENKMFTHRPDCFGIMGVAREVAGIQGLAFKSPPWYVADPEFPKAEGDLPLTVKNELPELTPRFSAITMSNVKVEQSPVWLQIILNEVGIKSINNIVDYTNFYMLETGQPLHAYDYDKVKALSGGSPELVIRKPAQGEKIKLLNGKEIEPRKDAIMIATDKQLIGIGGVMGGSNTEVGEHTKNIILECANFNMYSIRRTSMVHGLFTDAVTRFTKGQSPLQNLGVLAEITKKITEESGAKVASQVIDSNHVDKAALERNSLFPPVKITADFINARLGLKFTADQIKGILENVEFDIEVNGDELTITAPFWRTDIEIKEDIVEEVGRLHGFDKLPLELPKLDLTPAVKDPVLEAKAMIRDRLSKAGANELLTYSFVHSNLFEKTGQNKDDAFQISNALSPDLQYYRLSLTPSLLEKVHPNTKAGYGEFGIFEIGSVQSPTELDDEGLPTTFGRVAFVIATDTKAARKVAGAPYYHAKTYLEHVMGDEADLQFVPVAKVDIQGHKLFEAMVRPFHSGRAAVVYRGKQLVGVVGEYSTSTRRNFKLPNHCAGFELFLSVFSSDELPAYTPLSRFPKVTQDMTLKVPASLEHQEIINLFWSAYDSQELKNVDSTLSTLDIYKANEGDETKNVTLHFTIASRERTLTDKEVSKILDDIATVAKEKISAERI